MLDFVYGNSGLQSKAPPAAISKETLPLLEICRFPWF
jgi:hypothetical protein